MISFHPVNVQQDLTRVNPLFIGHFFSLKGMHWKKRKQRQGLILSVAVAWWHLSKHNLSSPGFITEEILITSLTRQVSDAKVIILKFFEILRIGYNFGNGERNATQISPKKLNSKTVSAIVNIVDQVVFCPGLPPKDKKLTMSVVTVQPRIHSEVIQLLKTEDREDLIPSVKWILSQEKINFYYEPAGNLLARDKSVWPIKSIEMWPGWLRTKLFGRVVDIENAYCQFIIKKLEEKYNNPVKLNMKYPDLLRMNYDKDVYRKEICEEYLQLELNDENLKTVKRLIMSLANGSNATPGLLISGSSRSEAVRIVTQSNPFINTANMIELGNKLSSIAKQFKAAKKELCIHILKVKPTLENQKKIFKMYFEWERENRYKIWEAVSKTGLMIHDGLDGIESDLSDDDLISFIERETSVRVSID